MKSILAVTGARAEFGILLPVLRAIQKEPELSLSVAVTGLHLLPKYGNTLGDVKRAGFNPHIVPMYDTGDNAGEQATRAFAKAVVGFGELIAKQQPDIVFVVGDRLEPFAAVVAAATQGKFIAHIHGGDTSDCGQKDDSIRHSISKFAHFHFAASASSAERLRKMGEEESRIHQVGSPALDTLLGEDPAPKEELYADLGFDPTQPVVMVLQHSVSMESANAYDQMCITLRAVIELGHQTLVLYPNNDPGSGGIIRAIEELRARALPQVRVQKSLDHHTYLSLLRYADCIVGNSSSGLIEAPAVGLPNISVGTRQQGREHGANTLFVPHDMQAIQGVVAKARSPRFRARLLKQKSPYGDGHASEKITQILAGTVLSADFLRKRITY